MPSITQPLREQHQKLMRQVEQLRAIADKVGDTPSEVLQSVLDDIYAFLVQQLIPHGQAEKSTFYPMINKVVGVEQITEALMYDHQEVERLTDELAALREELATSDLDEDQIKTLRRVLYSLYALVKLHFEKEEEIFLPLLDKHLTSDEAQKLFANMKQASRPSRSK